MMKKKDIESLLDNYIEIENNLNKIIEEVSNQDMDLEEKQKQLDYLAFKEVLNNSAISLLKKILR